MNSQLDVVKPIPWASCVTFGYWILVTLIGCSSSDRELPVVRDSAGIRILQYPEGSLRHGASAKTQVRGSFRDYVSLADLDFFDVMAMAFLVDDRIAVGESDGRLWLFEGPEGPHRLIGRPGEGPAEHRNVAWIARNDRGFVVGDKILRRVSYYDTNGEFERTVNTPDLPVRGLSQRAIPEGLVRHHRLVLSVVSMGEVVVDEIIRPTVTVFEWNPDSNTTNRIGTFRGTEILMLKYYNTDGHVAVDPPFNPSLDISWIPDGTVVGDGSRAELWYHDKGGITTLVRLTAMSQPVTRRIRDRYIRYRVGNRGQRARAILERMLRIANRDSLPAFSRVLGGSDNMVWAKLYTFEDTDAEGRWLVFDPTGNYVGRVRTPTRFRLLHASLQRLAGVSFDENDVQTPTVLDLEWTPREAGQQFLGVHVR